MDFLQFFQRPRKIPWSELKKKIIPKENTQHVDLRKMAWMAAVGLLLLTPAMAAAATKDVIIRAMYPIIELAQGISYPLTFLMVVGGMLLIITGNRAKGIEMIKWAVIGYIGVQFAPSLMKLLADVAEAMRAP